ncbi:uncharacterized protein LOC114596769 isoform X2 [Podarcis muralis]
MKDRRKGEKVEPRRCAKTNHVRRNLFGPVDHSNLQQDIQRILCTSMEKAKQRWNFDFWQEVPTEGLLQWEELQGHDVPPFYHTCVVREVPRPLQPMNRAAAKEPKARHNGKVIEKPSKMAGKKSRPGRKWRQTSLTVPVICNVSCFKEWQKDIARFIWQGKKPRIKYKSLADLKDRGGFSLPDLTWYYEASCICCVWGWVILNKNTDLLDLEGHGNRFGWYVYLWYQKAKVHKSFQNHIIRNAIFKVWGKCKDLLEQKAPWWLCPLEAISMKKVKMKPNWATYRELLTERDNQLKLKEFQEVKER